MLNHKIGTIADVQQAIWMVLTGTTGAPLTPAAMTMVDAANANPGFVPGPGERVAVLLFGDGLDTAGPQDLLVELPVPDCGVIGDFVWSDTNYDGLQGGPGEAGMNNVLVQLFAGSAAVGTPIATTTTGPAPADYPGSGALVANAPGFYQFKGLCPGTYTVVVPSQPALTGYTPSPSKVGGLPNASVDSNGSPTTIEVPTLTTVDRSIDFGYYAFSAVKLSCPTTTAGLVGTPFSAALVATDGITPYTFSIFSGALPAGLTLHPATGVISGTPQAAGTFTFVPKVTDSINQEATTGTSSCSIVINTVTISANCVAINATQGVAITPVQLTATGGTGGYTFTAAGLPQGLSMSPQGVISGTPTVSGTFPYTVTVKDSAGNTGTLNCSVTVLPPPSVCVPTTFNFNGSTSTSGTAGNIRSFTGANGIQVKASAFSKTKNGGVWAPAYLGSYPGGLGVTDGSEGDGGSNKHKVDNIGERWNYVLFEFSEPVIVNRAFLDAISADSDATVWIGTTNDPFNNHLTLNDATLAGFAVEENLSSSSATSRWADVNPGNLQGNVLVIATLVSDNSPEDEFKISKVETACPSVGGCSGTIGNLVWLDANGNGIQDSGERGIAGVTVQLKNGGTVLQTTTTNANGYYQFTGVCPGTYSVVIPTAPAGYNASPGNAGSDRTIDSNPNPATVTLTTNTSSDLTVDFGFVPAGAICVPGTFTFSGDSHLSGTAGNVRTFAAGNGVHVKASAFSKARSGGAWSTAYLGLYSTGLGVTDGSEGSGGSNQHTVDNIGQRWNYILLEFSKPVVVNRAFLNSIGADSDTSVWIGTRNDPFNNHIALSDAVLSSLTYEENSSSADVNSRWADVNSGNLQGNVLVIAASVSDSSPDDEFKVNKIETSCPTSGGSCTASIGDFVWADDGDGIQESKELGIANVTVKLYNASTGALLKTTTTNGSGNYSFTNLCAGTYKVEAMAPTGKQNTIAEAPKSTSSNDSNPNPAVVTVASGKSDNTIDFGFRGGSAGGGCTLTQGYWKNHDEAWPVSSLTIGGKTYSKSELLDIFGMSVRGDDSISLAHQLIAARLNAAKGALVPDLVSTAIWGADSALSTYAGKLPYKVNNGLFGALASVLDNYNNGGYGAQHCQ